MRILLGGNMNESIWCNGILWVWSDYYKCYVATDSPYHYWSLGVDLDEERSKKA